MSAHNQNGTMEDRLCQWSLVDAQLRQLTGMYHQLDTAVFCGLCEAYEVFGQTHKRALELERQKSAEGKR
jgi:hypothetical protein